MMAARRRRIPYLVTLHTGGHSSYFRHRLRNVQWRALGPLLRGAAVIVAVSRFEQRLFQRACSLDRIPLQDHPEWRKYTREYQASRGYSGPNSLMWPSRTIQGPPTSDRGSANSTAVDPRRNTAHPGLWPIRGPAAVTYKDPGLEASVTIEYIPPHHRERMAQVLGRSAVVAALSEYEAHPVAIMEALTLGIPTVGLDTAGIGDLVEDGLVRGVPRDASPAVIARTLIAALEGQRVSSSAMLPTWDSAAADLAHIYMDAVGTPSTSPGS